MGRNLIFDKYYLQLLAILYVSSQDLGKTALKGRLLKVVAARHAISAKNLICSKIQTGRVLLLISI